MAGSSSIPTRHKSLPISGEINYYCSLRKVAKKCRLPGLERPIPSRLDLVHNNFFDASIDYTIPYLSQRLDGFAEYIQRKIQSKTFASEKQTVNL